MMCDAGYDVAAGLGEGEMEESRRRDAPTRKREYGPLRLYINIHSTRDSCRKCILQ
jgi:hypothetical protein